MTEQQVHVDAYAPAEMARRVETSGVTKGQLDTRTLFALAVLAGAFIGLGANVATLVSTDNGLAYGLSRLVGGVAFSLGLTLVIGGGETDAPHERTSRSLPYEANDPRQRNLVHFFVLTMPASMAVS